MDYFSGLFISAPTPLSSNDNKTLIKNSVLSQELTYDPLYLVATVAAIALREFDALNHSQLDNLNQSYCEAPCLDHRSISKPQQLYKLSFDAKSSVIMIQGESLTTTALRTLKRDTRENVKVIYPHLVKFLHSHNLEQPELIHILKGFKCGLKLLKKSYQGPNEQSFKMIQRYPDDKKQEITNIFNSAIERNEQDFVVDNIEKCVRLTDKAICYMESKNEPYRKLFLEKIKKKNDYYYPLHQMNILGHMSKKRQEANLYVKDSLNFRWSPANIRAIGWIIQGAQSRTSSNSYEALLPYIKEIPSHHVNLRQKINTKLIEIIDSSEMTIEVEKAE